MRSSRFGIGLLAAVLVFAFGLLSSGAALAVAAERAADPAAGPTNQLDQPPALGSVILEDPLTARGALYAGRCSTGRGLGEFVGEGHIIKVTGPCTPGDSGAVAGPLSIPGLTVPDGEIRLQMKAVSGLDRVSFLLGLRLQADSSTQPGQQARDMYQLTVQPALGSLNFGRFAGGEWTHLAGRDDLGTHLSLDNWNDLAIRLRGPDFWILLNGEPVLFATDSAYSNGAVYLGLRRVGEVTDEQESAVVLRNLRISALAEGDPARLPTYAASPVAPSAAEPWIGDLRFGYDEASAVQSGGTLKRIEMRTIWVYYSWRGLTSGDTVHAAVIRNKVPSITHDVAVSAAEGTNRVRADYVGAFTAGVNYTQVDLTVVFSLGGREMARGYVLLE